MQWITIKQKLLYLLMFGWASMAGQGVKKVIQLPKASADCSGAIVISGELGPVRNITGPGKYQMVNATGAIPHMLITEFNPGWFRFTIEEAGNLELLIVSENKNDDYNFALFQCPGPWFCNTFEGEQLNNALRASSGSQDTETGVTGIHADGTAELIGREEAGIYCKPFEVKPGDMFYLYVDSRARPQNGYTIRIKVLALSGQ